MKEQYGKWKVISPKGLILHESRIKKHLAFVQSEDSNEPFVLKTHKKDTDGHTKASTAEFREIFRNEIKVAAMMDHPNVIKVVDYNANGDDPWMVTEYCKGRTLNDADLNNWTITEKYECFLSICRGAQYINSLGFTWGQAQLQNTFLKEDGKTPVIGDLEMSKELTLENGKDQMASLAFVFLSMMEGKDFNMMKYQESRFDKKIKALSNEIKELQTKKAELYNK